MFSRRAGIFVEVVVVIFRCNTLLEIQLRGTFPGLMSFRQQKQTILTWTAKVKGALLSYEGAMTAIPDTHQEKTCIDDKFATSQRVRGTSVTL